MPSLVICLLSLDGLRRIHKAELMIEERSHGWIVATTKQGIDFWEATKLEDQSDLAPFSKASLAEHKNGQLLLGDKKSFGQPRSCT